MFRWLFRVGLGFLALKLAEVYPTPKRKTTSGTSGHKSASRHRRYRRRVLPALRPMLAA